MKPQSRWVLGALLLARATVVGAQTPDLSGRWVREGTLGPAMDDVAPAWEEIALEQSTVTIRRAPVEAPTGPRATTVPEVYANDSVERVSARERTNRRCRSEWEAAQFVIACRQMDGGPGGGAPPVLTREVRFLDGDGRLVVEVTWQSDERVVTRTAVYRRMQQ